MLGVVVAYGVFYGRGLVSVYPLCAFWGHGPRGIQALSAPPFDFNFEYLERRFQFWFLICQSPVSYLRLRCYAWTRFTRRGHKGAAALPTVVLRVTDHVYGNLKWKNIHFNLVQRRNRMQGLVKNTYPISVPECERYPCKRLKSGRLQSLHSTRIFFNLGAASLGTTTDKMPFLRLARTAS